MNFSEALLLVTQENEKITRAAWRDESFHREIDAQPGSRAWVMKIHPNMFGLPDLGTHDRMAVFGANGYYPAIEVPALIRVIAAATYENCSTPYRYHRVGHWTPDMTDLVATDWEIASIEP